MEKGIKKEEINWEEYRKDLLDSLSNERLWALGCTTYPNYHKQNIITIEEELEAINNAQFDRIIDKYKDSPEILTPYMYSRAEKVSGQSADTIQSERKKLSQKKQTPMNQKNDTLSVLQEGMSYTLYLKDGRKVQNAIYHPCVINGQHYFSKGNKIYPLEDVLTHSLIGHNVPDNYQENGRPDPNRLAITDDYDEPIVILTTPDVNPITFQRRVQCLMLSGLSQEEAVHVASTTPVELELFYDIGKGIFAIDAEAVGNTPLYNPYTGREIPNDT